MQACYYQKYCVAGISYFSVDTEGKLNVQKTFRRRPGRPLNVLCTFNLRPVSIGFKKWCSNRTSIISSFLCDVIYFPLLFHTLGTQCHYFDQLSFLSGGFPVYDIFVEERNVCVDHHEPHTFHICLYWCSTLHGMF